MLAVNGLLPEDTMWYTTNWERGKVIEIDEKKLLEDTSKKKILFIDMACSYEYNKKDKRGKKIGKYNRLCSELRERQKGYTVKVIPTIIECLGGEMKELKENIRPMFKYDNNDKELEWVSREMQKTVL